MVCAEQVFFEREGRHKYQHFVFFLFHVVLNVCLNPPCHLPVTCLHASPVPVADRPLWPCCTVHFSIVWAPEAQKDLLSYHRPISNGLTDDGGVYQGS